MSSISPKFIPHSEKAASGLLTRLLSRLWTSAPERGPTSRRARFEALEPRILLSADLTPETADALADGLNRLGNRVEDFLVSETLLDQRIPLLLSVKENDDGIVVDEAPTISELYVVPVDANGDGDIDDFIDPFDDDESILQDLDTAGNADGSVDAGEFLQGWFFDPLEAFLNGHPATTTDVVDFLEGGFLFSLDQSLSIGPYTIEFEIVDAKVADLTEDPDAEAAFSVGFVLSITQDLPIDLGLEADALKLLPFTGPDASPEPPVVETTSSLSFGFTFGVFTGGQTPAQITGSDFFIRKADPLLVSVTAEDTDLDFKLNVGFLGAEVVDGSLDLQVDVETTLLDPNDPDVLGFIDTQHGVESTTGVVTATNAVPSANLDHAAGFFLRVGNVGITTPVLVLDNAAADLNALKTHVESALAAANLDDLIDVSLVGAGNDTFQFSLIPTSDTPLGFANEALGLLGSLSGTPDGDGPNAFEYLSDQVFLLSVGGGLARIITVRFPDPAKEEIGFGHEQTADLTAAADQVVAANTPTVFDITGNANFTVTITFDNGTQLSQSFTVTATDTDGSGNLAQLAGAIDAQLVADTTIFPFVQVLDEGGKIKFEGINSSVSGIRVQASGTATSEIGFASDADATLSLTAANNAINTGDLSGTATFDVTVTTVGVGTSTTRVTVAPSDNGGVADLAADIDAALASQGLAIDASVVSGKIVLTAQNVNVAAFDVKVGNQDLDDLVADVNAALDDAGLGSAVDASNDGGGHLVLTSTAGKSLEISRTLTFDAGVTFTELGLGANQLFSTTTGADSHVTFDFPVQVLAGLEDATTEADDDWDPADVAIVGNFDPFGPLSVFDAGGENRFNLNLTVDPPSAADAPIAVPTPGSLTDEIKLVNFAELLQFNVVAAESMIGLITQLGQSLESIASSGQFSLYGIPLSGSALADMLVFGDLVQTGLVYDVGEDGQLDATASKPNNHADLVADGEVSRLQVRTIVHADGQDTVKLLPSFVTAQQLASQLSTLLGIPLGPNGINARYDPADGSTTGNELSYTITLVSKDRISVGVEDSVGEADAFHAPFEFDVNLSPFGELTVDTVDDMGNPLDSRVTLTSRNSLQMTFGVDLDPAAPIDFADGGTDVQDLNNETGVDIKLERAVTGTDPVRQVFGIGSDATFLVSIDDGAPVQVTLSKAVVDGTDGSLNAFADELEEVINDALAGDATVSVTVVPNEDGKAEDRLRITLTAGGTTIDLSPVSSDPSALVELGFDSQAPADTDGIFTAINSAPSLYALTGNATFSVQVGANPTVSVTILASATAGNQSISELVADVNNALRAAGLLVLVGDEEQGIRAAFDAGRLVLTATAAATQFSVTVNGATAAGTVAHEELGLALGTKVADKDDFIVIDRNGIEHRVSLDTAADGDVQDLIAVINTAGTGFFEAGANASGTGLRLTDITTPPMGVDNRPAIRVATVNGSLAALKLGWLTNPTNPDDIDNENAGDPINPDFIEGGPIGTRALPERLFARDGELSGAFSMDLPGGGIAGDALVGIVGVDVTMSGGLTAELSANLQAPGGTPGSKVTLAQLQANAGAVPSNQQIVTDPLVSKISTLNYDTEVSSFSAGRIVRGATSGATAVVLEVTDNGSTGTLTLFDIDGTFQDNEAIVDTVNALNGAALANGGVTQQAYFGEFELDFAVKDGFADTGFGDDLEAALDGLTGTVPVRLTGFGNVNTHVVPATFTAPVVELVDVPGNLGALYDFVNLGYGDLTAALEQLEPLVHALEDDFAVLHQKLPIVNRSVNDLIRIADGFSLSVDNFAEVADDASALLHPDQEDVPTLTLQGVAQALRGAFGLGSNSTGIVVDVTSDGLLTVEFDLLETVSTTLGLDVDLSSGGLPNLTSGKVLQVSGELGLAATIGIDLGDPSNVYLFEENAGLSGNLSVLGNGAEDLGLVFLAMVGDVPVLVRDGLVDMDLEFTLGDLDFSGESTAGRKSLPAVQFGDFTAAVPVESFIASVPLFDPDGGLTGFIGEIAADGDLGGLSLPDIDSLADQLDEIASSLPEFNPLDNLLLLAENIDFFLENLQDFFDLELFGIKLPIVGDDFADGARFIEEFRTSFVSDLRATIESATDIQLGDITDVIEDFFAGVGEGGIDVSPISVESDLDNEDFGERYAQWNFELSDTLIVPFDLEFDIGVPLLGMDIDIPLIISIGWSLEWGFGVSFEEGAFIYTGNDEELSVTVDIDLPASESFSGNLAFLELIVANAGSGVHLEFDVDLENGNGGDRLGISDLGALELTPFVEGAAIHDHILDLDLTVGIVGVATAFPNITANFILDWELPRTALGDLTGDALASGLTKIALNDIRLDAGSFLTDFLGSTLGEIRKFTEPFDEIIDVLTTPIPVLSDLAGEDVTLLDIAGVFGEVDVGFIEWIGTVLDIIDTIGSLDDDTQLGIDIGSLTIYDSVGGGAIGSDFKGDLFDEDMNLADRIDLGTDANPIAALTNFDPNFNNRLNAADAGEGSGDAADAKSALQDLREGNLAEIISFPFLDNPLSIVGLLLGEDAILIQMDAPPLLVSFDYTQVFPIFGPLAATVGLGFKVGVDFSFGFDTFGVRRFADSGFTNPALIFDGFFLGDRENVTEGADINELFFEFSLTVTAELNLAIARAGAGVQGTAFIGFDLFDPDNDGAIHLSELINTIENQLRSDDPGLAPLSIFDLTGKLTLELFAFLIIDFGIFEIDYEFPITPEIEVFTFDVSFPRPPILATDLDTGTLQLNMGPNAVDRLNGDVRDGSEEFHVRKTADGIDVWSPSLGVGDGSPGDGTQHYTGDFDHIVALGGQGNDQIHFYDFDESDITFDLDGGVGNDIIHFHESAAVAPAAGAGARIRGGVGDDVLIGSHLDDEIHGGEGNDRIEGGRGYDILFGDDGTLGVLTNGDRFVGKRISVKDGDDEVYGGSSTDQDLADADADDIIVGGGGEDELHGDGGSDVILGDGGRILYALTDGHIHVASLRPDPFVPNDKADPSPAVSTSQKIENIFLQLSSHFSGTDLGDGADDEIHGGAGGDILFGGSADDEIHGDGGDDYVVGGMGFDSIFGGDNDDTLFGNAQNDYMEGNDGSDVMSGDFGDDVMHGNAGDDYMRGGRGLDVMYGDEDDDEVLGEGEPDVLFGGIGNDLVIGSVGADIMFGDDGIVAKLDTDDVGPFNDVSVGIGNPALITAAMRAAADNLAGSLDLILTDAVASDGNDILSGDGGGDIILGGGGDDLIGGDVDPRLAIANTPEKTTEAGEDFLIGDGGIVQFDRRRLQYVASVVDNDPTSFRDTIYGDNAPDVIIGGQGGDSGSFMLGTREITRMLAGGHGPGRGETDPEVGQNDIIIGDNGELFYANDDIAENFGRLEQVRTTDTSNSTGGADMAHGELGDDIIFGGVNGSVDVLFGNVGNDVMLGDNGEVDFAFGQDTASPLDDDTNLDTLDLIRSYRDGLGGTDEISGNAGDDVLMGGTGGDLMYGDDAMASAGTDDGEDVMLGDNADIFLIGTTGRLKVKVAAMTTGTAVDLITTSDRIDPLDPNHDTVAEVEDDGGADTMSGNAKADIMLGGVNNDNGLGDPEVDTMYGDRAAPTAASIVLDSDDILLGDNGLLDFTFGDSDQNILDLIRSFEDGLGRTDVISGNKGLDVAIGGSFDDHIYGDDTAASAAAADLGDLLLGDNADVFLVNPNGASGGDTKLVLDAAVKTIRTTDEEHPEYGGSDTISGNAKGDIIAGGVQGDWLYGDAASIQPALDGDDVILGDNGAFEWLSTGRLGEIEGISIALHNPLLFAKFNGDVADTDLTTLDLITTEQPTSGGRDTIHGDEGDDLIFGGTDLDRIRGDDGDEAAETLSANRDVLFGDHGRLYPHFSALQDFNSRNFFAIDTGDSDGGEGDVMYGEEGDDVMLGQQGDDRMWGGTHADDMIGGHNVEGGIDELTVPAVQAVSNPGPDDTNDLMDGGSGSDAMKGDNVIVWRRADDILPRFRTLTALSLYTTAADGVLDAIINNIGGPASDPNDAVGRDITVVDHADVVPAGRFGDDLMAGGADDDFMLGDLGNDVMQGDGSISAIADPGPNTITTTHSDTGTPDSSSTLYFNIPEALTDGDDYIEGSGGSDLIFGGLGQDDLIGGSSSFFGLDTPEERPDGSDIIFGGAGTPARLARNDFVGATDTDTGTAVGVGAVPTGDDPQIPLADRHSRDADFIMGDNANVFRLVGLGDAYLQYTYDQSSIHENRGNERIVVRAMHQLDYTLGGADFAGGVYVNGVANDDNGLGDLIHGESGDDYIFGMTSSDVIFGESDDDDIVGGYGNDWISGGTGQDGVLGDDGLIYTSRNGAIRNGVGGEALYGIAALFTNDPSTKYNNGTALNELISTPGDVQLAVINVTGQIKKTADLARFSPDPNWLGLDDEFADDASNIPFADDIIFGGLDGDFLHGGAGDDAISGAEALEHAYVPTFDGNGMPNGILDLGYNAFDLAPPIEPGDSVTPNPGNVLRFNPQDLDGQHLNNRFRAGEFFLYDEYDPLRRIELTASGELWKPGDGVSFAFLLNFDQTEGIFRASGTVPKATGQQTESYPAANDDGKDAIFGDLGNDWLVGGTGRDNLYGGWGNDLLNADDDQTTLGDAPKQGDPAVVGANDRPDTHPFYEDRAYGGAGRDVLIANTGGDRLIDWVGEYNSFLVPFAPFGQATVSRTLMPHLAEFLYALSAGDGADPTRFADAIGGTPPAPTTNNPIPTRNGEPFGELGLVLQPDFAWQAQTGAPADPQAGNIPGGARDVLRSAGFQDGSMEGFFVDSGKFTVQSGVLKVTAESLGGDAVSVFHVGDALPSYFEVQASVSVIKPTAGWKANSYVIFDYWGEQDFKFAGIDVSNSKLVIGHRDASGWHVDEQAAVRGGLKADKSYNVLLAIKGVNVTLVVDNKNIFSHTYQPRVIDDYSYGLRDGMIGVGSDNSRGTFDNVRVLVLPPAITFQATDDFQDGVADLLPATLRSGAWSVQNGRYSGSPDGGGIATSLFDLGVDGLHVSSYLDLAATVNTTTRAGFVFDRYSATDFKFVAIDAPADKVIIGHYTAHSGWVEDAVVAKAINAGTDYLLGVTIKGSTVSVTLGGQVVLGKVFNAVSVDGEFGLLAAGASASFDGVTVKTDDAAFAPATGSPMIAAAGALASESTVTLTQSALDSIVGAAITQWIDTLGYGDPRLASLGELRFSVADLTGNALGYSEGSTILIDTDAAGHGWFVDLSPADDSEFGAFDAHTLVATVDGPAAGRMDLVTVVMHEVGHVLGFDHADAGQYAVMEDALVSGARYLLGEASSGAALTAEPPVAPVGGRPRLDFGDWMWDDGQQGPGAAGVSVGWDASNGEGSAVRTIDWSGNSGWNPHSPFQGSKPGKAGSPNVSDVLFRFGPG